MNCNDRADNMNERKLTDFFKPGNNKNVRKDVDSPVQNETIIETTTSQDKEAITIEEDKNHFTIHMTFAFLKENLEKDNFLARPIPNGHNTSNHVNLTWILRRYVEDQISTSFHVISGYFFDVISIVEKSTLFPRTFICVISVVKNARCFHVTLSMQFRWPKNPSCFHVLFSM